MGGARLFRTGFYPEKGRQMHIEWNGGMEKEETGIFTMAQDMPAWVCGICAIADFSDNELNDLLELDGVERFVVYIATVVTN